MVGAVVTFSHALQNIRLRMPWRNVMNGPRINCGGDGKLFVKSFRLCKPVIIQQSFAECGGERSKAGTDLMATALRWHPDHRVPPYDGMGFAGSDKPRGSLLRFEHLAGLLQFGKLAFFVGEVLAHLGNLFFLLADLFKDDFDRSLLDPWLPAGCRCDRRCAGRFRFLPCRLWGFLSGHSASLCVWVGL